MSHYDASIRRSAQPAKAIENNKARIERAVFMSADSSRACRVVLLLGVICLTGFSVLLRPTLHPIYDHFKGLGQHSSRVADVAEGLLAWCQYCALYREGPGGRIRRTTGHQTRCIRICWLRVG